ncbi:MAG: hypothetical protein ACOVN8_03495, partial [Burkholderiaceae bacterium]
PPRALFNEKNEIVGFEPDPSAKPQPIQLRSQPGARRNNSPRSNQPNKAATAPRPAAGGPRPAQRGSALMNRSAANSQSRKQRSGER